MAAPDSSPTPAPRRLHLAASRFERLPRPVTAVICTPEWVHLGEPPIDWPAEIREALACRHLTAAARLAAAWTYRRLRPRYSPAELERLYAASDFRIFHFEVGDRLEFDDDTFSFSFSEHFFEHLFLDQAVALLRECHRILRPGAILRTVVPDADLRTYLPPEPPAYPSRLVPWTHHQKHKSRWNVYSLSEALRLAGFEPRPVMYCDRDGRFHEHLPEVRTADCLDPELVGSLAYLRRLPSLIVDGRKPAGASVPSR